MRARKDSLALKDRILETTFALSRLDKIIISAHAIFEGIGIAGLISAAFWYTTAPIAPDGFKGPISTYTIATTTIISLFLAIPIASLAFKKLIRDMGSLYTELTMEARRYMHSFDELLYELFKLRSLLEKDEDFHTQAHIVLLNDRNDIKEWIVSISKLFQQLESRFFVIQWGKAIQLNESTHEEPSSLSFPAILRDKELSANKSIKLALIHYIKLEGSLLTHTVAQAMNIPYEDIQPKKVNNFIYGTASGVACAEVLLSIGWTVISVLIGVDAIEPISNWSWATFAVFCIVSGIVFGLGMGLSRHKEQKVQLVHLSYKTNNKTLIRMIENVNNLFTEYSFMKGGYAGLQI